MNVHGLNDIDDNRNNNNSNQNLMNDYQSEMRNARSETFCKFIQLIFCRRLKFLSFTSLISIFLATMYIITLFWGITESNKYFLMPNSNGLLYKLFMKDQQELKNGQIWRFLTYSFIHRDLTHVTFNVLSFLIFGSLLEDQIKSYKMGIVYLVSGILGILFSSLIQNVNSVGASVCDYGNIGALVSYVL